MKKLKALLLLLGFLGLALVSCDTASNAANTPINNEKIEPPIEEDIPPVEEYIDFDTPLINGTTGTSTTPDEIVGDNSTVKFNVTDFNTTIKKDGPLTDKAFPSLGTPKLLVIPVSFDASKETNDTINDIKIAFNGTEEETGWESLKTYYQKSSYNKLNITADVEETWFKPAYSAYYYEKSYNGSEKILTEALAYYNNKYNYADYDYDNDGYIDGVWLVYNYSVNYGGNSMWWAFTSWANSNTLYDGKHVNYYAFAGTDFMEPSTSSRYDVSNISIDSHTFIHETGHLMGLDDYYDYDSSIGANGGLYGADMMDYNIGDHGMISKMLLGWVNPTIVTGYGSGSIDLTSFTKYGNFLLIANHEITSIYDEYFLVEFYTNDGLNYNDLPIGSTSTQGIRIIHIDAHQNIVDGQVKRVDSNVYYTAFKYNNSDTNYKFCTMLRADAATQSYYLSDSSLFTPTSSIFGQTIFEDYTYHDGASLNFNIVVNTIIDNKANITITFNEEEVK